MEHKDNKADLLSSNENWNTLYGQINEKWKYQEMLNKDCEYDLVGTYDRIKHHQLSIAEYNKENDSLKYQIGVYKALVKKLVITKKYQEPNIQNLNKIAEELKKKYHDLKHKDEVLKGDPQLLGRLYQYLHEYQNIAQVSKTEERSLKLSKQTKDERASNMNTVEVTIKTDENIANSVIKLENRDVNVEQVTNHYNTGEMKDGIDKRAAKIIINGGEPDSKAPNGFKSSALTFDESNDLAESQIKNEIDKPADGIKTEFCDPKTKKSFSEKQLN